MSTQQPSKVTLHTYFRSSCSARLRIALALKQIPYEPIYINLLKNEQSSSQNTSVNPSSTVPTLIIQDEQAGQGQEPVVITQSLAALEYLDEAFPHNGPALLPPLSNPKERAIARTLAQIISCDIQPVTNLRILTRVAPYGADRTSWSKDLIEAGFEAYERVARDSAGKFSVGDCITVADLCLVPAVWGAERVGIDLSKYPVIQRVMEALDGEECVKRAHWRGQGDTPEDLKW
ncbi:maleylacetoacetate isomerase MaiA [Aspergillus stella-maris]|uniref:maleylacetoacetate isomerase MaiA n=1 Tax=Aspergillus stella-maris TaxID=1810926 RepID=UPI003CCD95A6